MLRWTLTVVTVLLLAVWLVSGFPGVRWHYPGVQGARQGYMLFSREPIPERTLWTVVVDRGQVQVAKYRGVMPELVYSFDLDRRVFWRRSPIWFTWPKWSGADHDAAAWGVAASGSGMLFAWGAEFAVSIPLWMPPLLTAIPAAFLWRGRLRLHRRRRAGACLRCGYDLAGLLTAHGETGPPTCPECGT